MGMRNMKVIFLRDRASDYAIKPDREDDYVIVNVRSDYKINRNHAVEVGYQGRYREGDLGEYDRNMFFLGWKLSL